MHKIRRVSPALSSPLLLGHGLCKFEEKGLRPVAYAKVVVKGLQVAIEASGESAHRQVDPVGRGPIGDRNGSCVEGQRVALAFVSATSVEYMRQPKWPTETSSGVVLSLTTHASFHLK